MKLFLLVGVLVSSTVWAQMAVQLTATVSEVQPEIVILSSGASRLLVPRSLFARDRKFGKGDEISLTLKPSDIVAIENLNRDDKRNEGKTSPNFP